MREDENQFKVIYSQPRVPDCIKIQTDFALLGFILHSCLYLFTCLFVCLYKNLFIIY